MSRAAPSTWWQRITTLFGSSTSNPASRASPPIYSATTLGRPRLFSEPFQESDLVAIRIGSKYKLSRPLTLSGTINLSKGSITHRRIIGTRPGDVVETDRGLKCWVEEPSLADYIRHSRRLVTPIYPDDAEKIVSRLDINASAFPDDSHDPTPQFEILEAGTGHGSLSLYLSRAISAFNSALPGTANAADYAEWRSRRKAVIHSIDVSEKHSKHARKVVQEFRRGIYAHNIDFHVGSVSDWAREHLQKSNGVPRLAHAFLDLPSPVDHLVAVTGALSPNGKLMVFTPSITTLIECSQAIKSNGLDLYHDTTLEFGNNGSTGGREWDLRQVIPRKQRPATLQKELGGGEPEKSVEDSTDESDLEPDSQTVATVDGAQPGGEDTHDLKWVCRPKVGDRINGGGFLGVFVKRRRTVS